MAEHQQNPPNESSKKQMPPLLKTGIWLLIFWLIFSVISSNNAGNKIPSSEIKSHILSGKVTKIIFIVETFGVEWEELSVSNAKGPQIFRSRAAGEEHFKELYKLAEEKKIPFSVGDPPNNFLPNIIWILIYAGMFFAIWHFLFKKQIGGMQDQTFSFGKSDARLYKTNENKVTFADVAGCDEVKEEAQEVVEFLKNPMQFIRLGARVPKGVLLHGDPGTGKTLIARAIAGEASVAFLSISGSKFEEMFVGVGASRVRDLFNQARNLAPCIIFIDEIDAIGGKRNAALTGGQREHDQSLNQLLAELDGFDQNDKIVVIAATNRLDILDEALTRSGRFDRRIFVPRPDINGREKILQVHADNILLDPDVDLRKIAKMTFGMVGADLANIINEAALIATKKKKDKVEYSDLSEAVDKVSLGPIRKSIKLDEEEKKLTAYHEAGHALVAEMLKDEGADSVRKVTIVPRGGALGLTQMLPEKDRHTHTKQQLEAMIAVCLGGKAAEELNFGICTTGISEDLKMATMTLRQMVFKLGMYEEIGMVVYRDDFGFFKDEGIEISDKTKEKFNDFIKKRLADIFNKVKGILKDNKKKLDALVKELMEKETLDAEQFQEILNRDFS